MRMYKTRKNSLHTWISLVYWSFILCVQSSAVTRVWGLFVVSSCVFVLCKFCLYKLHACAGVCVTIPPVSSSPPPPPSPPPVGEGDAEDAWLQRSEDVNTDHRTVHGRPSAGSVETAGHHHDRQVQTALGRARWGGKTHHTHTHTHTHTWLSYTHLSHPVCAGTDRFSEVVDRTQTLTQRHTQYLFFFFSCVFICPLLSMTGHTHTFSHTHTHTCSSLTAQSLPLAVNASLAASARECLCGLQAV